MLYGDLDGWDKGVAARPKREGIYVYMYKCSDQKF